MIALPFPTVVTKPEEETFATDSLLLLKLSVHRAVFSTFNCSVSPRYRDADPTFMAGWATVTRQVWETPFTTAETDAVPGAAAVSCPFPLTVTEEGLEEVQVIAG